MSITGMSNYVTTYKKLRQLLAEMSRKLVHISRTQQYAKIKT